MNRRNLQDLYGPCTKTSYPDAMIGWNGGTEWVHLFRDDSGDWNRSGMPFPSKMEALATLAGARASFHGEPGPAPTPSHHAYLGGVVATLYYLDGHLQLSVSGLGEGERIDVEVNGRRYQPRGTKS